jgi:histidyl-tRNA synthetase
MMYRLKDAGDRDLCLAPEYTAIVQQLAKTRFKHDRDVKLFYVAECFRGEKPQEGRYRQFTQLGVEILNPERPLADTLCKLAEILITRISFTDFNGALTIDSNVSRGLDYYKDGKGFEITCDLLGSSKQICGGGEYDGGIGFAIGIDRLMLAMELIKQQQQLSTQ